MRGNAKNLKPMLTPTVERCLREVQPADGYALVLWFADQYRTMLDVLESVYDTVQTPRDMADALDRAPEPPRPPVAPTAASYFAILRGEAQDLVESNILGKLADRERKRKKAAEKKRVAPLSADSAETPLSADSAESAENPESAESADSAENADSFSPLESSLSKSGQSVSQSTRAHERTHEIFSSEDYRRAGEAEGYGKEELSRFVAKNERGVLSPAEAVKRWNERRTPTERAGGASAVEAARQAESSRAAREREARRRAEEEDRHKRAVFAILARAEADGVTDEAGVRAVGVMLNAFCGDVEAAVEAWHIRHSAGGDSPSPSQTVDNLSTGEGSGTPRVGSCGPGLESRPQTTGSRGARD